MGGGGSGDGAAEGHETVQRTVRRDARAGAERGRVAGNAGRTAVAGPVPIGEVGRRERYVAATTRAALTGAVRPLTVRAPTGSGRQPSDEPAASTVAVEARISPPDASAWRRWATFTASPTTVYSRRPPPPSVPATTVPVLTPIPISS